MYKLFIINGKEMLNDKFIDNYIITVFKYKYNIHSNLLKDFWFKLYIDWLDLYSDRESLCFVLQGLGRILQGQDVWLSLAIIFTAGVH